MNQSATVETQVEPIPSMSVSAQETSSGFRMPMWLRCVIAAAVFVMLSIAGGIVWMFGIMMLAFSLDGASSSELSNFVEPFVVFVWPASIAMVPLVTSALTLCKVNWMRIVAAGFCMAGLSAIVYVAGIVLMFSSR